MEEQEKTSLAVDIENDIGETSTISANECDISQQNEENQLENEPNNTQMEDEPSLEIQMEDEPMDTQADESEQINAEVMDPSTSNTCENQDAPTSSNPVSLALPQTLASGFALARIADFFAKEDERILRCHGFKPIFIPCERLETVHQRDRKDLKLRKMREEREKRMAENEERRRQNKEICKIGDDSDSDKDARENKRRKKEKDHKRRHSSSNNYSGSVRDGAKPPQKCNFAPVVQCCVCDLIVSKERFGGRDTLFCSEACISKKADQAKKCVKEGERILVMDHKGSMMNHSQNPTIENLEEFLLSNPSYQPVLASKLIEEANRQELDPVYQKKVETMRVDVRKVIETALQKRSKAANMNFSLKRYKDLGMEIERALFSIYQDVNLRYRKWFKVFITVVNDEKNGFFRDVLRDKVSVKKLVTLSADQMNSTTPQVDQNCSSLADNVASTSNFTVAAADSTSISDMPEENVVSSEVHTFTIPRNKNASTTSRHNMVKKTPLSTAKAKSAIDDILGDMNKDTTHLHHSHLYDANCGVCKQNNLKKFAAKERLERLEAKLEQKRKAEEAKSSNLNFPNLDPSIQAAMLEDGGTEMASNELDLLKQKINRSMTERSAPPFAITGDNNVLVGGSLGINDNVQLDPERHSRDPLGLELVNELVPEQQNDDDEDNASFEAVCNDDDDNDAFFGDFNDGCFEPEAQQQQPTNFVEQDSSINIRSSSQQSDDFDSRRVDEISRREKNKNNNEICPQRPPFEQSRGNSRTMEIATCVSSDKNESWKRNDSEELNQRLSHHHQVWNGKFVWNSFISFDCKLTAISNRGAFKAGRELPQALSVIGRSEANGVWHYIGRLTDSWDKQVILLLVEQPKDSRQYDLYLRCFDKVSSCDNQQIIVLDLGNNEQIKDGYVFTLGPGNSLPSVLYPLDGPGLPEWCRTRGCMILMLVRRMDREDKLWRKQDDENWRQQRTTTTTHSSFNNIENEGIERQKQHELNLQSFYRNNTDLSMWRKPSSVTNESLLSTTTVESNANLLPIWPPRDGPVTSQTIEPDSDYRSNLPEQINLRNNSNNGSSNNMQINIQERDDQPPNIETVQELLGVIQNLETPENIVILVGKFLQAHPDLTPYEKMNISFAVRQRIAAEQNKTNNNNENTTKNLNNTIEVNTNFNNENTNVVVEEGELENSLEEQQLTTSNKKTTIAVEEETQQANNDLLRPYSPSDHIVDSQEDEQTSLSSTTEPRPVLPPPFPFPSALLETTNINKKIQNALSIQQRRQEETCSTLSNDAFGNNDNNTEKSKNVVDDRQQTPPPPPPPPLSPSLLDSPQPPPPPPPPPSQTSTTVSTVNNETISSAAVLQQPPPPAITTTNTFPPAPLPPLQQLELISTCLLLPPPPPPPTLAVNIIRENEVINSTNLVIEDGELEGDNTGDASFCDDIDLDNFDSMTKLHQFQHAKQTKQRQPIINQQQKNIYPPGNFIQNTPNSSSGNVRLNLFQQQQPPTYQSLSSPLEMQNRMPIQSAIRRPLPPIRPPFLPNTPMQRFSTPPTSTATRPPIIAHPTATASNRIPLGNRLSTPRMFLPPSPQDSSNPMMSSLPLNPRFPGAQPLNRFRQNAPLNLFQSPSGHQNSNPLPLRSTVPQPLQTPPSSTPLNKLSLTGSHPKPLKSVAIDNRFTPALNEQSISQSSFTKNLSAQRIPILPQQKQFQQNNSFTSHQKNFLKDKKVVREEEEVDYFTEELEIPVDFGLPTSFFSNKQRWED